MRQLILDNILVDESSKAFVIAEIGHNHQGKVDIAREMFRVARDCGANAVKLQKRHNKLLFTRKLYESSYIGANSYGPTYGAHREALEFSKEEYVDLQNYAKEIGLTMFATAFDFASVDFLAELDMPIYKVASADLDNIPLIKYIAGIGKPIIVSTGGGTLDDVKRVYDAVMPINEQLCILQCTASYPVEDYSDMNLRVVKTYRDEFPETVIGLSDHESGIAMALVAYALGARVIEKHFTLNRAWHGTDHGFSLSPSGLKRMIRNLERSRLALGNGEKCRYQSEEKPLYKMSKKLVAAKSMPRGHVLEQNDIAIKSPGDGLKPYELDNVIGKILITPLNEDDNISFDNLKDV